jgi:hypothetical protein
MHTNITNCCRIDFIILNNDSQRYSFYLILLYRKVEIAEDFKTNGFPATMINNSGEPRYGVTGKAGLNKERQEKLYKV